MATWRDFWPWIRPELPKASNAQVNAAIRLTVIDFCERTKCWQETQRAYTTGPGVFAYNFQTISNQGEPYLVMAGKIGPKLERDIEPQTPDWCDDFYPGWANGQKQGQAAFITQLEPGFAFYLVPTPTSTEPFELRLACRPKKRATACPQFVLNDHHDAIVAGTKARMMVMAGVPWSNSQQAGIYQAVYAEGVDNARSRVQRGFTRARSRALSHFV